MVALVLIGASLPDEQQGNYVSKEGGDEMEGPPIKNTMLLIRVMLAS